MEFPFLVYHDWIPNFQEETQRIRFGCLQLQFTVGIFLVAATVKA